MTDRKRLSRRVISIRPRCTRPWSSCNKASRKFHQRKCLFRLVVAVAQPCPTSIMRPSSAYPRASTQPGRCNTMQLRLRAPPNFIVNLDLTLKHSKFEKGASDKNSLTASHISPIIAHRKSGGVRTKRPTSVHQTVTAVRNSLAPRDYYYRLLTFS